MHVYIYMYVYVTCEQNDPCSGCGSTRFRIPCVCVYQRFNGMQRKRNWFSLIWALEPNIAFGGQSLEIQWEVCVLYSHLVPICTPHVRHYVDLPNTKDGNLLISADVQVLELATWLVHPHRALAERYRVGIPATFLASQLAIGICTKEKVGNFKLKYGYIELNLVKRKETKLILYKASLRILSQVNLRDVHQWRWSTPHSAQTSPVPGARWALPVWISQCVSSSIEVLVVVCPWEKAEMI